MVSQYYVNSVVWLFIGLDGCRNRECLAATTRTACLLCHASQFIKHNDARYPLMLPNVPKRRIIFSMSLPIFMLIGCGGGGGGDSGTTTTPISNTGTNVTLAWDDPNPPEKQVLGYLVYFGAAPDDTPQLLSTLYIGSADINANAPSVRYNTSTQIGLRPGDRGCFRVKAFNNAAESDFSNPACLSIST
jgi:hypothetical protein